MRNALSIVWLVSGSESYGLRTFIAEVAPRVAREPETRLTVVAASDGDYFEDLRAAGVEVLELRQPSFAALSDPDGRRSIVKILRETARQRRVCRAAQEVLRTLHPRIIHTHTPHYHLLGSLLAKEHDGCSGIWHWHGPYIFRGLPDRLLRLRSKRAARTIAISEFVRSTLPASMQARCSVVHNGVDLEVPLAREKFRERFAIPSDVPLVGAFGNVIPRKGFRYFVEAIPVVLQRHPSARFAVVGDVAAGDRSGEVERLRSRASELGVSSRLLFTGLLPGAASFMSDFDVLVSPTIPYGHDPGEGFGLVVIEAMRAGVPVVATRLGAFPEIVEHGVCGLLVAPESAEALAGGINWILSDKELSARLAASARSRVEERFGLARLVRDLRLLYSEVAERGAVGP